MRDVTGLFARILPIYIDKICIIHAMCWPVAAHRQCRCCLETTIYMCDPFCGMECVLYVSMKHSFDA